MARRVSIPLLQLLLLSTLVIGSAFSTCINGWCYIGGCTCCDLTQYCELVGVGFTCYCHVRSGLWTREINQASGREVKTAEPSDFLRKLLDQEAF